MPEEYATKIELAKEVENLEKKNDKQDIEIKENRDHIASNDIQTGRLETVVERVEKAVNKLTDAIGKFGTVVVSCFVLPVIVAAIVFTLFKG